MTRALAFLSSAVLLAVGAHAQCLGSPATTPVTLSQWSSSAGFASAWALADEGISNPPIDITAAFGPGGFPMAGAVGNLNQLWVNTNGEIYLTDSAAGLTQPAGGAQYGVNTLAEARGGVGGSPRIFAVGSDNSASTVAGAAWAITTDIAPGSVKVSWTDMARLGSVTTDRFSFSIELLAGGVVILSYSPTFPVMTAWCGISIGNDVGTTTSPSRSLRSGPIASDSGTEGLLYQNVTFDLANFAVLISPNGTGGYLSTVACEPASHQDFGTGCHTFTGVDDSSLVQLFAGSPAAKAALDGNAMLFTLASPGYVANWLPGAAGALYVPPSGTATSIALTDDSVSTITPSTAAPVPGGTTPTWTVSSNGILAAGPTSTTDYSATLAEVGTQTALSFYCWRDYNPSISGSGQVKYEEVGGVLYVTYDGVYEHTTTNPATFQWQVTLATGDVMMVFSSLATSTNTTPLIAGCTLVGTGATPTSSQLSTVTPFLLQPQVALTPMTLSAAPAPVINPSTIVTYTADNLPEFVPGSGVYLSTLFLSANPNPLGFDLNGILTTVPGCNAWILSLDLDLGAQVTFGPTATWNFTFSNAFFTPGNVIAAQAVSLFDGSFPLANGESGGFLLSNGVRSVTHPQ